MPLANLYGVTFKSRFQRCYNRQTIARDMNEAVELVRLFSIGVEMLSDPADPIEKIECEVLQWGNEPPKRAPAFYEGEPSTDFLNLNGKN